MTHSALGNIILTSVSKKFRKIAGDFVLNIGGLGSFCLVLLRFGLFHVLVCTVRLN